MGVISPALRLTTRIVLEVVEDPYKQLTFSKVESREFLEFEGVCVCVCVCVFCNS